MAVPMGLHLIRHRPIRLPRGFAFWGLFLLWLVLSLTMLPLNPSYTIPGTWAGRLIAIAVTLAEYAGVTVTLLYVGNLSQAEMPQQRVVSMLGMLFVFTVAGGILGVLLPKV